jgi:transposase
LVFRTRDLLVRQRTQIINAIRGHPTEYAWIAPKGPSHVTMLADLLEEEEMANSFPEAARIAALDKEIARRAREDEVSRRLMTVPGIGPLSATAIAALAPPAETFFFKNRLHLVGRPQMSTRPNVILLPSRLRKRSGPAKVAPDGIRTSNGERPV